MFFFVDPYVQLIPNWSKNLHDTQMQHILTSSVGIFSWTCVGGWNPCGGCTIVTPLPQIAKLPKNQKVVGPRFGANLSRYIAPLWIGGKFCHLEMIEWRLDWKTNPNWSSKLLPLKTTIDIPIIISYIMKLSHLKFGLWVVTSNLQTFIQLDFFFKL